MHISDNDSKMGSKHIVQKHTSIVYITSDEILKILNEIEEV